MTRLPTPGSDDGDWGTILNNYLSVSHATDGTLKSGSVDAATLKPGAVPTSVLADGAVTEKKLAQSVKDKLNASGSYLPIKNGVVPLTDSLNDFFVHVNITDDGSATTNWADRLAFYFSGTRTGYHNEYGELRARPAKPSTIALRAMGHLSGSNGDIFQVADATRNVKFGVSETKVTATIPFESTENITAPNLITKTENWANTTDPVKHQINLTYPLDNINPDTQEIRVTRGDGQANFKALWTNEWGALRGTSPYAGYGDALVRAIRTNQDIIGTGTTATASNALELIDRRTGAASSVMWGRSWVDGHLTRNGTAMADSILLGASDPVPANLPEGTIIFRKGQ